MPLDKIILGSRGENLALDFLKSSGYKIICLNYKTKLGEIDIIAQDQDVICFVEVKTRASDRFGSGKEAVSRIKQRQIAKAAIIFLKERKMLNAKARFDVVSVDSSCFKAKLDLIKNAFELDGGFIY
ncbi:MAG: YraN family protein [Candidatus Omnitrophica bacterium]|nr:YraN family protein [Candidatus Omnitrophota bacterium]